MARIPGPEQLGAVVPQRAQSFVPGPRDIVGPALQRAGRAVGGLAQVAFERDEERQRELEQRQRFGVQTQFLDFQNRQNQTLTEAGEGAAPGAFGFRDAATREYDASAKEFLKTIPDELKPQYDAKLVQLRNQVFTNADRFERTQKTGFYNAELDRQRNTASLTVRQNPRLLQEQINGQAEAINASGLSPTEKAERIRKMKPVLVAEAVQGLAEAGDYAAAQELLDRYVDAAVNRGEAAQGVHGLIRQEEGFRATPYWDVNAHRIGYGSDTVTRADGTVERVRPGMVITKADAARDLDRRVKEFQGVIIGQIGANTWSALPDNVKAGLTSVAYNYGDLPDTVVTAVGTGDIGAIATAVGGLSANKKRRAREAAIIRGEGVVADVDIGTKWYDTLQTKITKTETNAVNNLSKATRDDYSLSIAQNPANVTEQEIFENVNLQDDDKVSLIKELRAANKEQRVLQDAIRAFQVGPAAFNEHDTESRKQVDAYWKDQTDQNINNPDTIVQTQEIVRRSGIAPRQVMRALQSGINSNNVQEMATAAELTSNLHTIAPRAFDGTDGSSALNTAAADWKHLTETLGLSDERAAQEMIAARDPARKRDRSTLNKESDDILKDLTVDDVSAEVTGEFLSSDVGYNNAQGLAFLGDYKELYRLNYRETGGNEDLATARTVADMRRLYGKSEFAGDPGLGIFDNAPVTKYPIENYYPAVDNSHDYIREQMAEDAHDILGEEIDPDDIILSADPIKTREDIEAGRLPRYIMLYKTEENGIDVYNSLPTGVYFTADPKAAQAVVSERRRIKADEIRRERIAKIGTPEGYIQAVDIDNSTVFVDPDTREIVEEDKNGVYVPTGKKYRRAIITRPDGSIVLGGTRRMTIQERLAEEETTQAEKLLREQRIREQQAENFRQLGFEGSPLAERFGVDPEQSRELRGKEEEAFRAGEKAYLETEGSDLDKIRAKRQAIEQVLGR